MYPLNFIWDLSKLIPSLILISSKIRTNWQSLFPLLDRLTWVVEKWRSWSQIGKVSLSANELNDADEAKVGFRYSAGIYMLLGFLFSIAELEEANRIGTWEQIKCARWVVTKFTTLASF